MMVDRCGRWIDCEMDHDPLLKKRMAEFQAQQLERKRKKHRVGDDDAKDSVDDDSTNDCGDPLGRAIVEELCRSPVAKEESTSDTTGDVAEFQFSSYVMIQKSGVTNMFDLERVKQLTHLDEATIKKIMKTYSELAAKYPDVIRTKGGLVC